MLREKNGARKFHLLGRSFRSFVALGRSEIVNRYAYDKQAFVERVSSLLTARPAFVIPRIIRENVEGFSNERSEFLNVYYS
jgi:hypothetical protein